MKSFLLIFASVAVLQVSQAEVPQKAALENYKRLWTHSLFTSLPPEQENGIVVNPLDDYTLTGIAPVPGGYRITIMSKKNPDDIKVVEPGVESEFQVISVDRNPDQALATTVVLALGLAQGTVSFEPELITLNAARKHLTRITPSPIHAANPPSASRNKTITQGGSRDSKVQPHTERPR